MMTHQSPQVGATKRTTHPLASLQEEHLVSDLLSRQKQRRAGVSTIFIPRLFEVLPQVSRRPSHQPLIDPLSLAAWLGRFRSVGKNCRDQLANQSRVDRGIGSPISGCYGGSEGGEFPGNFTALVAGGCPRSWKFGQSLIPLGIEERGDEPDIIGQISGGKILCDKQNQQTDL